MITVNVGIERHEDRRVEHTVFAYSGKLAEHRKGVSFRVEPVRSRVRLAKEDAPAEQQRRRVLSEAERRVTGLRVVLATDAIRVTVDEGAGLGVERVQVLASPFEFGPSAV